MCYHFTSIIRHVIKKITQKALTNYISIINLFHSIKKVTIAFCTIDGTRRIKCLAFLNHRDRFEDLQRSKTRIKGAKSHSLIFFFKNSQSKKIYLNFPLRPQQKVPQSLSRNTHTCTTNRAQFLGMRWED